jgi:hypothetical protein
MAKVSLLQMSFSTVTFMGILIIGSRETQAKIASATQTCRPNVVRQVLLYRRRQIDNEPQGNSIQHKQPDACSSGRMFTSWIMSKCVCQGRRLTALNSVVIRSEERNAMKGKEIRALILKLNACNLMRRAVVLNESYVPCKFLGCIL